MFLFFPIFVFYGFNFLQEKFTPHSLKHFHRAKQTAQETNQEFNALIRVSKKVAKVKLFRVKKTEPFDVYCQLFGSRKNAAAKKLL